LLIVLYSVDANPTIFCYVSDNKITSSRCSVLPHIKIKTG
jgi:hypothetical protein